MDNVYLDYLLQSLKRRRDNEIKFIDKNSNNYQNDVEVISKWYEQLLGFINSKWPKDFVRAINVFIDVSQNIRDIEYIYCSSKEMTVYIALNIYWI